MPCTKNLINMTSTTPIVENLHATDYLNYVVFGQSFYPVKRKNTLKKYVHKSLCTKRVEFSKEIVGLQESCSPHGGRGLLHIGNTFWLFCMADR